MPDAEDDFTGSPASAPEEFGPYLVYERLGIGGMATVHRAKKRGIAGYERGVALKRILPHFSDDTDFIGALVREAKLASLLVHPNIAQIYDLGRIGDIYYIAMEHVDGFDVSKLLRHCHRRRTLPPLGIVLSILCELCEALDYAHRFVDEHGQPLGIVHRDVSPSNLLVALTGHLKVIDFGIAKASPRPLHTDSGRVKGKLGYMSPEAVVGGPVSPSSDVFSLGVVAHELLTVQPLFSAKTDHETLRRVREAEIRPPSSRNAGVPPALDRLVLAALEREDRRRLQTAGEFRRALEEIAVTTGLRFSSSDVAAWWARGTSTVDDDGSDAPSPNTGRGAGVHGPSQLASMGSRSYMPLPASAELSGEGHAVHATDRLSRPMEGAPGEHPSAVSASVRASPIPRRRPRPRSRTSVIIALAGLCMIAVGIAAYVFIMRPAAAVTQVIQTSPAVAPGPASVRFIVRPPDATVQIGDQKVSGREILLEQGVYSIAVSHAGYKRWTSQITLRDRESHAIEVALEPAAASVRLSSQPPGLVAELDGEPLSQITPTAFEISAGPHRLVVVGAMGTWSHEFVAATDVTYAFHAVLPALKRLSSAATASASTRAAPATPERPAPRSISANTPRTIATHESAADPEDRIELDPEPVPGKSPVKAERQTGVTVQPAPTLPPLASSRPAAPSGAPPLVPASTVTKLSGEIPAIPSGSGSADVYSKLCIGLDGHVTSAKIVKAAPGISAELQRTLLGWRYRPYVDDAGHPSPVCFAVTFRLVFERAHRTATGRRRSTWLRDPRLSEQHTASRPVAVKYAEEDCNTRRLTITRQKLDGLRGARPAGSP